MPIININTKNKNSVEKIDSTEYGDSVNITTINGASFITEELSKQVSPGMKSFVTSFEFLRYSLDVYLNGIKLCLDVDFEESSNYRAFSLIDINTDYSKILNANTYIIVKYIKK